MFKKDDSQKFFVAKKNSCCNQNTIWNGWKNNWFGTEQSSCFQQPSFDGGFSPQLDFCSGVNYSADSDGFVLIRPRKHDCQGSFALLIDVFDRIIQDNRVCMSRKVRPFTLGLQVNWVPSSTS